MTHDDGRKREIVKVQQHVSVVSFPPHKSDNILIINFLCFDFFQHFPPLADDSEANANEPWQTRRGGGNCYG